MGLAPIGGPLERAAPDAALGGFGLFLVGLLGNDGLTTEIDSIPLGDQCLAEIGHALCAAHGDDAAVAILAPLLALHIAAFDQRCESCLRCAAARPGFAVRLFTGLMQFRRVDAEQAVLAAIAHAERVPIDRHNLGVRAEWLGLDAAIELDEQGQDQEDYQCRELAEHLRERAG